MNLHHEAIVTHLAGYEANVEICLAHLKEAQRHGWATEARWARSLTDARLMVSCMESLLGYVTEASEETQRIFG